MWNSAYEAMTIVAYFSIVIWLVSAAWSNRKATLETKTRAHELIVLLRTRASIRRGIQTRKSVQEGRPDRLADLLDDAADTMEKLI